MHDLSNVSYEEAVTKLASWYQQKQASIGEGVGRVGEWISNNPGTAATLGGGVAGGLVGGAAEGPDGWRGRVRRSLTGAVAGAGIGGGTALAGKALFGGGAPAAASAGPSFDVNGKKMQFDPKAVAGNPALASELGSLDDPSGMSLAKGTIDKGWETANKVAPFTTMGALPILGASNISHHMSKVSPGAGSGPVADSMGSTAGWKRNYQGAKAEAWSEARKAQGIKEGPLIRDPKGKEIRLKAINKMIEDLRGNKVNPTDANQHTSILPKGPLWQKGRTWDQWAKAPRNMQIRPDRGVFGGTKTRLALGALPLLDLARAGWSGASDDSAKKQKLLELVRQHAKPVEG
jgi:hypothetical protein